MPISTITYAAVHGDHAEAVRGIDRGHRLRGRLPEDVPL
jgi:hypothetical protein